MIALVLLLALSVVAVVAAVVTIRRDGYRRVPVCRTRTLES